MSDRVTNPAGRLRRSRHDGHQFSIQWRDAIPAKCGPRPQRAVPLRLGIGPHGVPCRHRRRWLVSPKFEPLLTDSRTGVSVPGCYAAFTSDCRPPLSDEHWLSEVVLREASDNDRIRLLGLSWAPDREIALYPRSVANKVLWERHNHALWRLDATAGATFAALRRY